MLFPRRLYRSLHYRWRWSQLGVPWLRSAEEPLESVRIAGRGVPLAFPEDELPVHGRELSRIYYRDCYGLRGLRPAPRTILDIGGNIGLFSMVARHHFPRATIHCYEPNPELQPALETHLGDLAIETHPAAVGQEAGHIQLTNAPNSLHSVSSPVAEGEKAIPQIPIREAIDRMGGEVDLLKLDCEGAEWEILEDEGALAGVHRIVMEYHLWARPGSTADDLEALIKAQGFEISSIEQRPDADFGFLKAAR